MKKKLAIIAVMFGICMVFAAPVNAGDINAAEQSIIAYYSGTVSYGGKTYQFTEAAKQQAYNKLISDDVNLTDVQAAAAIRQANANLDQGISQGYLVEVPADGAEDGTNGADAPNTGDEGSGFDIQDGSLSDDGESDDGKEKPERPKYSDAQKENINSFVKESLEEGDYAKINAGGQGSSETVATVERFLKGTVNVVAENGDVVLASGLPIKNTGYNTGKINPLPGIFGIACLILIVLFARKKKHYIIAPVLCSAAGIFLVWAFAAGFLESETGKWNSVFQLGAPEYAYAAEADGDSFSDGSWQSPLQGEQYGEILCEEIGLRVPLYYGDTDEILEKGAGTYAGMHLPGEGRGILISGHDTSIFAPLESAKAGMTIQVKTKYGQFEYEVTGTEVLDVLEYDPQKYGTKEEELALYTCYPFGDDDELRSERFFVYAKKVSGPKIGE